MAGVHERADRFADDTERSVVLAPARPPRRTRAEDVLAMQRSAGNQGVARMLLREPATAPATAAPATAPAAGETEAEVDLYPILDRHTHEQIMVPYEQYQEEGQHLGNLLRYLTGAIAEDAKDILGGYPFGEIEAMYQDVREHLVAAHEYYAKGELVRCRRRARAAATYSEIETKAHAILMDKGMLAYVGERVGTAVIGFFEGAAETLGGMVDTGASVIGAHPDIEGKIRKRYDRIHEAFDSATGIDSHLTHDRQIGVVGGKIAESLAVAKGAKDLGKVGGLVGGAATAFNLVQAAAGVKGAVEAVVEAKRQGRSWGSIFSDPSMLAELANGLAGVAGLAGAGLPQAREILADAGLVLSAGQTAALTTAYVTYKDDPNLSEAENFQRRADLIQNAIIAAGTTADDVEERYKSSKPFVELPPASSEKPAPAVTPEQVREAIAAPEEPAPAAPEEAAPATGEQANPAEAALLKKSGLRPMVAKTLAMAAKVLGVIIKVRPVNVDSVEHLDRGSLSKPELIKAKSITKLDELLGAPPGRRGLVGLFEPRMPSLEGLSPAEIAKVKARYDQRLGEWTELPEYYAKHYPDLVREHNGLLEIRDARVPGGGEEAWKAVAGDVDIYDIVHADGSPLSPVEAEIITNMLRSMGVGIEHGAHEWWRSQSPKTFNPAIDANIRSGHTEGSPGAEQLVAFAPGKSAEAVWAGDTVTSGEGEKYGLPVSSAKVAGRPWPRVPGIVPIIQKAKEDGRPAETGMSVSTPDGPLDISVRYDPAATEPLTVSLGDGTTRSFASLEDYEAFVRDQ